MMMGPPGAGKSTWVASHARPGQVVCSADRLRTSARLASSRPAVVGYLTKLWAKVERELAGGRDVLVDACHTRTADRTRWLALARTYGARTHLVIVDAPLDTMLAVQRTRTHPVPEAKVRTYYTQYRRALTLVPREGWGQVTRVQRGTTHTAQASHSSSEGTDPQPRPVSTW